MKNWRFGHLINVVLLTGTVIGILQPAWSHDIGITQIVLSLFHPAWTQEFLMRWLLILAFFGLSYSAIVHMLYRNLPITVIATKLVVKFGANGQAVMEREQLLRANLPNVTAHLSSHAASTPSGKVLRDQIKASVYCHGWTSKDWLEKRGTEKRYDVLHIFEKPLPYAWYMPLVPTWILNREPTRLFKFLKKYVIVRKAEVQYVNEFDVPDPIMNFVPAGRYQNFNLTVEIHFDHGIPDNFKVREITNGGVTDINAEKKSNNCVIIRVDKIGAGTIRVTWLT